MYNYLEPQSQFVPTQIAIPQYRYTPYARAYIMFQENTDKIYPLEEGFTKGTMFPEFYVPYNPKPIKGVMK